jgi:hypothetical protein
MRKQPANARPAPSRLLHAALLAGLMTRGLSPDGVKPGAVLANPTAGYGASLTTIGDMYGDGLSDYAVAAPFADGTKIRCGKVFIYYTVPGAAGAPQPFEAASPPLTLVLQGDQIDDDFGWSIAGVGDVNGDGYPDLLIGSPYESVGGNDAAGQATLYLGSAFGFSTIPAWKFSTGEPSANVGTAVARAGDVNGDGYDDWLVGAPYHALPDSAQGAAYLFLGGPGALSTTPAWTFEPHVPGSLLGASLAGAGDVNGDGFDDIVIGAPTAALAGVHQGAAYLFLGHANHPALAPDRMWYGGQSQAFFGASVETAGDVNGDGYADWLVGEPYRDAAHLDQGYAYVYFGGPTPLYYGGPEILTTQIDGAYFGKCLASAGDVNGDGFADVIVGAPNVFLGNRSGEAFLYLGNSGGVSSGEVYTFDSSTAGEETGVAVGTMGDVDGDGLSESWAGAANGSAGGEVLIEFGIRSVPGGRQVTVAQGGAVERFMGASAAAADVNGDGYDDLITGATGSDSDHRGWLSIYLGGQQPFPPTGVLGYEGAAPDWTFEGDPDDWLGYTLANAGDVNGDGSEDFLAGAPYHSEAGSTQGEAILFYGSPTGPSARPPWSVVGDSAYAYLGFSVTGGGDLNGDGYDDVAIGCPGFVPAQSPEGRVKVYYGSALGLSHMPGASLLGDPLDHQLGPACAIVGDVNDDGYDDLVCGAPYIGPGQNDDGRVYVYLGSPSGVHEPPSQTLQLGIPNAVFGIGIARAGDVNGDGYADVAIGAPGFENGQTQEGKVFVFEGSPAGLVVPAAWSLEGQQPYLHLGLLGVSGAGDVNGDGFSDLLVGRPNDNDLVTGGGALEIFLGSPTGLNTTYAFREYTDQVNSQFGYATGGEADFNGDGFDDVLYSWPGRTTDLGADDGLVLVRFGNTRGDAYRNHGRALAAWRFDDSAPIATGLVSDSKTAFRLKGTGRSPAGRTRLALDWEVKPGTTPFDFTGLGHSAWTSTLTPVFGVGSTVPLDFAVTGLTQATAYHWRARYRSKSPLFPFSPWITESRRGARERHLATAGAVRPVGADPGAPTPPGLALLPAVPNPFAARAVLAFELPAVGDASLAVFDLRGRLVRRLFSGRAPAGRTSVTWDGDDARGVPAPPGAYFARLTAGSGEKVVKFVHTSR